MYNKYVILYVLFTFCIHLLIKKIKTFVKITMYKDIIFLNFKNSTSCVTMITNHF